METEEKLPSVTREITGAQAAVALKIDAGRGNALGKKRLTKDERLIAAEAVVKQCYAEGRFLVSGPKDPRTGGIVIATGPSRDEIEALMARDPFVEAGVVTVTITPFSASNRHPALA